MHNSVSSDMFWRSLGASKHKSPLFHPLEHWLISCSLEKRSAVVAARFRSDSLLCVDGAQMLRIPPALQGFYSLPLGPIFSCPVGAPHNWGLCSLWSSVLGCIYAQWSAVFDAIPVIPHTTKTRPYPLLLCWCTWNIFFVGQPPYGKPCEAPL